MCFSDRVLRVNLPTSTRWTSNISNDWIYLHTQVLQSITAPKLRKPSNSTEVLTWLGLGVAEEDVPMLTLVFWGPGRCCGKLRLLSTSEGGLRSGRWLYRLFHPHPSICKTYISKTFVNGFDKCRHIQIIKSICDIDVHGLSKWCWLWSLLVGFPFQLASSHSNGDVAADGRFWFLFFQILRHFDLRISSSSTWHLDLCSCFFVWKAHSHQSERGA